MDNLTLIRPDRSAPGIPRQPLRVVGIDLGTTNSTIAEVVWDPLQPLDIKARCIEVEQPTDSGTYSHVLVPSAVAISDGVAICGHVRYADKAVDIDREPFPITPRNPAFHTSRRR